MIQKAKTLFFYASVISFCTVISYSVSLRALQYTIKDLKDTQLEIDCPKMDFQMTGVDEGSSELKIQTQVFENKNAMESKEWAVVVQREKIANKIKVLCVYPEKALRDKKLLETHNFHIQVQGQSVEAMVHAHQGKVKVQNWAKPIRVTIGKGNIEVAKTSGNQVINLMEGDIEVSQHKGKLTVDTYKSKLRIAKIEGNIQVTNFSGSTYINEVLGEILLDSKMGKTEVIGSEGSLKFDADQGSINFDQFKGAIEGQVGIAQVVAKLVNPVRVKLKIKNATVKLQVPSSSGANVYMALSEGQFSAPGYLTRDEDASLKTVRGSLRGGESGRVSITGESGRVNLSVF